MATTNYEISAAGQDGEIWRDAETTWSAARDAETGDGASAVLNNINVNAQKLSANYYVYRGFLAINTSGLDDLAVISDVKLYFNVISYSGSPTLHVVQTSQASTSNLSTSDFNNLSFTSGGSIAISSTGWNYITFNETARGWIVKDGYTKLGILDSKDQSNTTPTNGDDSVIVGNYETDNKPYLAITYTIPSFVPQIIIS